MYTAYFAGIWSALLLVWFFWANKHGYQNQVMVATIVLILTAFVVGESSGEYYVRNVMIK